MEKKPSQATATDWRTEITKEARRQTFHFICMSLKEQCSAQRTDGVDIKKITDFAKEQELKLFNSAKSKDDYLNALIRKVSRRVNHHGKSSSQAAVPNPQYHQQVEPISIVRQHIHPTAQLHSQSMNVRQMQQQFGMHNQSRVSAQNTSNSQSEPQAFRRRDFGIHTSLEMLTQHPNLVNLQQYEKSTIQVKKEVTGEDFHTSKSSHQHHTAIEHHKQQQSMGASAAPKDIPNSTDWHDVAFAERERAKKTFLPILNQVVQTRHIHLDNHANLLSNKIVTFLQMPRDKAITIYDKERFYRCLQTVEKVMNGLVRININLANSQQSQHGGQGGFSGSRINPVQQSDSVKLLCQPVIRATTGTVDCPSSIAPREKGSVRSETDCNQTNLLQNEQRIEKIKSELLSPPWTPKQKSTENIPVIRSKMSMKHHMNSNYSPHPHIHEASQLGQIVERPLPTNSYISLHGRASPAPSSSIVGLGKSSPNVTYLLSSNFQVPQHCNALEILNPKAAIKGQSQKIRSSPATTSQFVDPTSLGNNGQLSTETLALKRLVTAVASSTSESMTIAVSGISSVGYMEDAIIDPWCNAKVTDFRLQDVCGSSNNMKRKINATALNDIPSPCSDITESEPTVTSRSKKLKKLSDYALLEEMKNINKQLIETVVELELDMNLNRRLANAGTILRCLYRAVTDGHNSKPCPIKLPVLSVKLLVPLDYPKAYPVFLSKFNIDSSDVDEEFRDLSNEATSMLRAFLRTAPDCLSLEDYAKVWDECARSVVSDYAQRAGGGCLSARYGTWEDCVTTD